MADGMSQAQSKHRRQDVDGGVVQGKKKGPIRGGLQLEKSRCVTDQVVVSCPANHTHSTATPRMDGRAAWTKHTDDCSA